jgi:hypothetical protein
MEAQKRPNEELAIQDVYFSPLKSITLEFTQALEESSQTAL